ncbi:MAG TPA: VTT domain-containing protein [Terriglobales bacterium]|nr:VTT domain-containing protein [Terriglobales bacterium]
MPPPLPPLLPHGHGWLDGIFYFFVGLGAPGLVLLGVLDSSFLTLPFANDLAVIVLVSLHHEWMPLYVAAATAGSLAGCWIMFEIGHAGGENFIRAHMSESRYRRIHATIGKKGPVLLAVPALIPPPFPFSAFVLGAGALEVPRKPFLAMLAAMRALRFLAEAVAALLWGRGIVRQMQTPAFRLFVEILMALALAASAYSLLELVRGSRRASAQTGAK